MEEAGGDVRRDDGEAVGDPAPHLTPEPAPEPTSEPAPESTPEPTEAPVAAPAAAERPYRPMARRKLTLVLAAALVLGVLAGGGAGYAVQSGRPATPLPPLVAAGPTQPAGPGPTAPAPQAADDRDAVYEGNLLKLLVPVPAGAKNGERGWLTQSELADQLGTYRAFENLNERGFRRAVEATWDTGHDEAVNTDVTLTQYRDDTSIYTEQALRDAAGSTDHGHQQHGVPLPGTVDGTVMASAEPYDEDDIRVYVGQAFARVGNIFVEVYISSLDPVHEKDLRTVITEQLERL
ncbi:hypothetical protein [Streptomyces sp. NPDC021224]|uniref:hypothetical protein n=1 Tax=unclassified Streptomyces TaxID=2593676 RepID=UPI003789212A